MAQLKSTTIMGDASITGTLYPAKIQGNILLIPTASNGTTYGAGTSGQVLTTNGTSIYWSTISIPTVPTMDSTPTNGNSSNTVSSDGVYDMVMGRTKIYTATCSTAAATAAKVATLDDSTGFSLAAGVKVAVTFTYGNSATTPTLNVNSSGAISIVIPSSETGYAAGQGASYNNWGAYETILFTYTGTYWTHNPSGRLGYLAYNTASGRQAKITASGILKGDGSGGVTAATAGTDYAAASHTHGDITNTGDITVTAPTIASGDKIIINDESDNKITNGPSFGTSTTTYLRNDGSWATPTDNRDSGYGKIQPGTASTSASAIAANTTRAQATTYNEMLTVNPGNKWIAVAGSNSTAADSDSLTIGHSAGLTAKTSYGSTSTTASANGGSITVTDIKYDEAGHITASTDRTITLSQSDNDTKNTAGSTDTSSKIYLIGATSQAANPQTYSDNEVYATSGVLSAKTFSGTNAELQNIKMVTTLTAITSSRGDLGSGVSPRYLPYKWYASLSHNPVDGEIIVIKTPSAGNTANVYLSINGDADGNYRPIAVGGTSRLTTQFASGTILMLVYESSMSVTTYVLAGADSTSTVTGIWRVLNYYDSNTNTLLRTYKATNSIELPILLRNSTASQTAANASISTYGDSYGAIAGTNTPTINPSTGVLTANSPSFTGTPVAPTATAGTNTTQIATTAFVKTAVQNATVKGTITLNTTWSGSGPYTQTVTLSGYTATANTKVDIQLTAAQIAQLITDGVTSLLVSNSNGTLTMYATGAKPTTAMTIQVTCTEVTAA